MDASRPNEFDMVARRGAKEKWGVDSDKLRRIVNLTDGSEKAPAMDLVRLAIPRRVYTQSHIDYVAEAVIGVAALKRQLRGYRITKAPAVLRHFTALFEPLAA